jgi:hypothetical protein
MRVAAGICVVATGLAIGAAQAHAGLDLRAESLDPAFRAGIGDYTLPASTCASRFELEVAAPGRTESRIGDSRWFSGTRSRHLKLDPGQAVRIKTRDERERDRYFVRCLPADFPAFSYERSARPASELYAVSPSRFGQSYPNYVAIFDRHGVPVWWRSGEGSSSDAKVLGDGSIASVRGNLSGQSGIEPAYEIRRPNGSLVRTVSAVGAGTDAHDLQVTGDGNYLLLAYVERTGRVDASGYNGDRNARVVDGVVQKVSPRGELLWQWSTADHVGLEETGRWWERLSEPYDIVHINSVEEAENGDYLISLRHADAAYRLDGESGAVKWKLGGTPTPESLEVAGDPYVASLFGGQHDVRELGDGSITLHDNGSDRGRPPRAVRYEISSGVATLVDAQSDPLVSESDCCGSSRFANGAWVASWGGTGIVSEFAAGERTFTLDFGSSWSYRATPVDGATDRDTLRAGMNDQVELKD